MFLLAIVLILSSQYSIGFKFRSSRYVIRESFTILSDTEGDSTSNSLFEDLRSKLRSTCIYLVGMMGSGKSTTGDILANKIGYRFLDTDEIAEFMIETPISEFFAQGKEAEFRDIEYQVLMELAQYTRVVVATGGGIVERTSNWGILQHGIVVFLDMSPEDIFSRLSRDATQVAKRPLLQGPDPKGRLLALSEKRHGLYSQADVKVPVSQEDSPEEVAERVASSVLTFIASNGPLWQKWKQEQDKKASVTANQLAGPPKAGGTIEYVALSDIKSGKVKLPGGGGATSSDPEIEGIPKSSLAGSDDGNTLQ